jgi:hypothetical protein
MQQQHQPSLPLYCPNPKLSTHLFVVCNMHNMASNVVLAFSLQPKKGNLSLFALSDHEIMNQIYATHVHDDEKFDVESLLIVVKNILKRATQIADTIVLVWYHVHFF